MTVQEAYRGDRNVVTDNVYEDLEKCSERFEYEDLHDKMLIIIHPSKPKVWAIDDL